jgi:hypothetical protein
MYHKVGNTGLELGANFKSHKVVAAAKIMAIQHDTFDDQPVTRLIFDGIPSVTIADSELKNKPVPQAGMYLVAYGDENNYFSFSPADTFEEGNTRLVEQQPRENASPVLKYFAHAHLPPHLAAVSRPIGELAVTMDNYLPDGAEKSAGLRKLLEAKDCLVRAIV